MRTRAIGFVLAVLLVASCVVQAGEPVKAYKNLIFGESKNETNKMIMADKSLSGSVWACLTKVGSEQYGVECEFDNDRLYLVRLTANFLFSPRIYNIAYFEKALDEAETLRDVIEAQYGEPHEVVDISCISPKDGQIAYRYAWNIDGVKIVTIGVARQQYNYWAVMTIGYIPILTEIASMKAQEKEEQITGSAKDF